MKKLLIALMLCISSSAFAQDAKDILKKSWQKCQSVNNGYYEMKKTMKSMSYKDTSTSTYTCSFKKLTGDTLFSSAFHIKQIWNDTVTSEIIYTGNELINAYRHDSTATITAKDKWASRIKSIRHNYTLYRPLTQKESRPMPHDSDFIDADNAFKYVNEETVGNMACYHIRLTVTPHPKPTDDMKMIGDETNFWINKADFVPVQYSEELNFVMNNDSMCQYEKFTLTKYELNNLSDESPLTIESVPKFYKLSDYVPYTEPKLLPKDTLAPDWNLKSLKNEEIGLKDLKGKLVLVDFFYKSCYPCMKALPTLESLNQKYKDKGLTVIGIDPMDHGKDDDLEKFLSKRGITYNVLLSDKILPKQYHVSGYPTLYLIDKDGKILFSHVGYSDSLEHSLEEVIRKYLGLEPAE